MYGCMGVWVYGEKRVVSYWLLVVGGWVLENQLRMENKEQESE
jgi:hypothetical protein